MCEQELHKISINEIDELPLSVIHALYRVDIFYVDDLLALSESELMRIEGIGKRSYAKIINSLKRLNLDVSKFEVSKKKAYKYPYNFIYSIYGADIIVSGEAEKNLKILINTLPLQLQTYIDLKYKQSLLYKQCAKQMHVSVVAVSKYQKTITSFFLLDNVSKYILENVQLSPLNPTSVSMVFALPIVNAGFCFKAEQILLKNDFETIGDMVRRFPAIKELKGIGKKTYKELVERLEMFGINTKALNEQNL